MTIDTFEAYYLQESDTLTLGELVERTGLSEEELRELAEVGAFPPPDPAARGWTFTSRCVVVARTARQLREEYALDDTHSLAVVVRLTQRIEALERELRATGRKR